MSWGKGQKIKSVLLGGAAIAPETGCIFSQRQQIETLIHQQSLLTLLIIALPCEPKVGVT